MTALPHPAKTSQKVPKHSAKERLIRDKVFPPCKKLRSPSLVTQYVVGYAGKLYTTCTEGIK
jgi:hypothetical protein